MGYGQYSSSGMGDGLRHGSPRKPQRKFVFGSHSNTAHVWAQQNEETREGRSGDGRMRFDGPTIYSYGTHFAIASFTGKQLNGRDIVLFNSNSYSVSTRQHQGHTRGALSGLPVVVLDVADLTRWLGYMSPKDRTAWKRSLWTDLLIELASATKAAGVNYGPDTFRADWSTQQLRRMRDAIDAARVVFGFRGAVPADPVAWDNARRAKIEADELARKIKASVALVTGWTVPQADDPAKASEYNLEEKIRSLKQEATRLYAARLALGKAGKSKLVKLATKHIKAVVAYREPWETRLAEIKEAEAERRRDLKMAEVEAIYKQGLEPDWQYTNMLPALWAHAIKTGRADLAERIGRSVHVAQWRLAVPGTFKVESYDGPPLTLADWLDGKGSTNARLSDADRSVTYVRRKGDRLETSRGAEVPWSQALLAFRVAQHARLHGLTLTYGGADATPLRVGHFSVSRIEPDGTLTAGCHVLRWPEMEALAIREAQDVLQPRYPLPVVTTLPLSPCN
jgi:hypothetical protein